VRLWLAAVEEGRAACQTALADSPRAGARRGIGCHLLSGR
jgi:hypothetical protein